MLNRKQRKQNNKELAKSIGEQLSTIRKQKKLLLEDLELECDISFKIIDKAESGYKILPINYLQYIASIYDMKLEIKLVKS